jgi:hypothetical protein
MVAVIWHHWCWCCTCFFCGHGCLAPSTLLLPMIPLWLWLLNIIIHVTIGCKQNILYIHVTLLSAWKHEKNKISKF